MCSVTPPGGSGWPARDAAQAAYDRKYGKAGQTPAALNPSDGNIGSRNPTVPSQMGTPGTEDVSASDITRKRSAGSGIAVAGGGTGGQQTSRGSGLRM